MPLNIDESLKCAYVTVHFVRELRPHGGCFSVVRSRRIALRVVEPKTSGWLPRFHGLQETMYELSGTDQRGIGELNSLVGREFGKVNCRRFSNPH